MAAKKKAPAKKTTRSVVVRKKATATTKSTAKKPAARKPAVKKAPAKKAAAKKATIVKEAFNKTQLYNAIVESTELTKKQVTTVFESLADIIEAHVKSRGAGEFTLPGLLKIRVTRKPATKARKGINPFTGEETVFKAKPARNVVKIKPLKKLKDMVS